MNYTLANLANGIRAQGQKRRNTVDEAIYHQADLWGKTLVLRKCMKVLSESQKAFILAEISLTSKGSGKGKANRSTAGVKRVIKGVVNVNHGETFSKAGA